MEKTIAELEGEYREALEALEATTASYADAARREAEAKNRVNSLQKIIRDRIAELVATAPRGTDWHNEKNREPFPCT